jgi:hydrogenase maturation protease HycI
MDELYQKLYNKLNTSSKIVFMGIGEEKLTDDGVGPYIISELLNYSNQNYLFINAGTDPMARIDDIVNFDPSHLIIFDTCTLNEEPGTVAIIERKNIGEYVPISTHTIPIHIVIDLIIQKIPGIEIFMIGFVPKNLDGFKELKIHEKRRRALIEMEENIEIPFFQINLSETIQKAADQVINIIKKLIKTLS